MADRIARVACVALGVALAPSARAQGMGLAELRDMMSWGTGGLFLVERLEYAGGWEDNPVVLESIGWYGGAYDRVWYRLDGENATEGELAGEGEVHLYYGRLVHPYWDLVGGVRVDADWDGDTDVRGHLAIGLIGLAPLRFEFAPTLFVSHEGDVSARLEADYQLLLTQRLVLTPDAELNVAVQRVPEWGVGAGPNDLELGLRLWYEIVPEVAPYVGVSWERKLGDTADLAEAAGEPESDAALLAGIRLWR